MPVLVVRGHGDGEMHGERVGRLELDDVAHRNRLLVPQTLVLDQTADVRLGLVHAEVAGDASTGVIDRRVVRIGLVVDPQIDGLPRREAARPDHVLAPRDEFVARVSLIADEAQLVQAVAQRRGRVGREVEQRVPVVPVHLAAERRQARVELFVMVARRNHDDVPASVRLRRRHERDVRAIARPRLASTVVSSRRTAAWASRSTGLRLWSTADGSSRSRGRCRRASAATRTACSSSCEGTRA